MKPYFLSLVLSLTSFGAQAIEYASADFRSIGLFPGVSFAASDVSADGRIIAGSGSSGGTPQAIHWTESQGIQPLGFLPGIQPNISISVKISGDGSTVVGGSSAVISNDPIIIAKEAFRWTELTGMVGLGFFDGASLGEGSEARGVSADGGIVVGSATGSVNCPDSLCRLGFVWTPENGLINPDIGGDYVSDIFDISADGSTMLLLSGHVSSGDYGLWSAENSFIEIPRPNPNTGHGYRRTMKLSADGTTVVMESDLDSMAYVWSEADGFLALDEVRPRYSLQPFDVSADGSVVVGYSSESFGSEDPFIGSIVGAFIWDADAGTRFLEDVLIGAGADLTGWRQITAHAISDDGLTIIGNAINPDGNNEVFIARLTPVPVPAAFWLFGSALGLLGWMRRKAA